jgi:hypothetical protein
VKKIGSEHGITTCFIKYVDFGNMSQTAVDYSSPGHYVAKFSLLLLHIIVYY